MNAVERQLKQRRQMRRDALRFRHLRKRVLGISQSSFAAHVGVRYETVCAWETCKRPVPRMAMIAILELVRQARAR